MSSQQLASLLEEWNHPDPPQQEGPSPNHPMEDSNHPRRGLAMWNSLDISTSALVAQRIRLHAITSNLANISTTHNEHGEPVPYQPRFVIFQTAEEIGGPASPGVRVASVEIEEREPLWKYQPGHPDAIRNGPMTGYVAYPNINMMTEMTDALEAARAYEANLGAIEITKDLHQQTLRILA